MSVTPSSGQAGDLQAAGQRRQLLLNGLVYLARGLVNGRGHEVLEHFHILFAHDFGVNLEAADLLLTVHLHLDHPAAGTGFHHEGGNLLLHPLLLLLELLHQLSRITKGIDGPCPGAEAMASPPARPPPSRQRGPGPPGPRAPSLPPGGGAGAPRPPGREGAERVRPPPLPRVASGHGPLPSRPARGTRL